MGRFYKTADPQFLDFMYELPQEAMMKAIGNVDSQIAKQETQNEGLRGLLKLDAIDFDRPEADKILENYESQIDELSAEIQKNPLEFRKKSSKINALQKNIHTDFTRGDAARIQSQYNTRLSNYQAMKEALKKNPELYNYADIEKLQGLLDQQYGESGGFRKTNFQTDRLREFVDIKDFDKFGKAYESDIIERLGAFKGKDGYLYTSKDKKEFVDPALIQKHITDLLMSDQKLNDYYDQQVQLGNIGEEEYGNLIAQTANRIGEKYGFSKRSKGLTSIKGDPKDAAIAGAREQYFLNNPIANTTPGIIQDKPLLQKYQKVDGNGNLIDNNSLAGIDSALSDINSGKQKSLMGVAQLALDNKIPVSDAMSKALKDGDFSVLKSVRGTDGKVIDPQVLLQYQNDYDQMVLDQKMLQKKKEVAASMENPDEYLAEQKDKPALINNINDYQTFGLVDKDQAKLFNKHVNEWRRELDGSRAYFDAPLQFDVSSISKLPPELQDKVKDGMSISDLINSGVVRMKQKKVGSRPIMRERQRTINDDDFIPFNEKTVTEQVPTGETEDIMAPTTDFENFKVNGKFAKPSTQLDGQGNVLVQFEVQIDGTPLKVYMDESKLSNKTVKSYMDLDAMKAAHHIMEATGEGLIDEEGFDLEGITFYKNKDGKTVTDSPVGPIPIEEAAKWIAAKRKAKKNKLLR